MGDYQSSIPTGCSSALQLCQSCRLAESWDTSSIGPDQLLCGILEHLSSNDKKAPLLITCILKMTQLWCRWTTVTMDFRQVERHLYASGNYTEKLASYKILKNGSIFQLMLITIHRDLEPLLTHIAIAGASHHIAGARQYGRSGRHTAKFEHRNPRNADWRSIVLSERNLSS